MMEIINLHTRFTVETLGRGELAPGVLDAVARVPRHCFVPTEICHYAYADGPLPIGFDKTISQPFIVALMTDLLETDPTHRVLEVGTGLGYHTAVLALLAGSVHTVEIIEELTELAEANLAEAGCNNIAFKTGDGSKGWLEHAPFDLILVAAASERAPSALIEQLTAGGRMVVPTGPDNAQRLTLVTKDDYGTVSAQEIMPVRFAELESYH